MDPLSALSVAAAVVQFVDFGQRLFLETWHIYRSASGENIALEDLSVVSNDLVQLSAGVERALSAQRRGAAAIGASVARDADESLLRICGECAAIASEIQIVLPRAGYRFHSVLKANEKLAKNKRKESLTLGDCFRKALRQCWNSGEVEDLKRRLGDVRQQMMMAATISIWSNTRDSKGWEQQFSTKLDKLISMVGGAIDQTQDLGPGVDIAPPDPADTLYLNTYPEDEDAAAKSINFNTGRDKLAIISSTRECIQTTRVAEQIVHRLWSKEWKPNDSILSSFPEETLVSASDLKADIIGTLGFESMTNREDAINNAFRSTYEWVFNPSPPLSDTGEPMWSSLPDWLLGQSSLPFWITGKPGSGKSTMMKYIVNHGYMSHYLQVWAKHYPVYNIHYYAWKPGTDLHKSEEGLFRTLLHQILHRNPELTPFVCPRRWTLFHTIRELRPEFYPPWTITELQESFAYLLKIVQHKMRLAIFVDGLDEFDIAPVKLCAIIQDMARHGAIKVCVASRSWPQFNDAFTDSPMMEMHLLTNDDIRSFVLGHFENIRAFTELNALYSNGGYTLLLEAVSKAQGVFLWIALVTQTMLQAVIEGSSLPHLRTILDKMPVEIENLYDAIYWTIPERLLPEVSGMLQMYASACAPVDWLTLWLADETRGTKMSIDVDAVDIDKVYTTLKRRVSARTRGILELVRPTKTVEYLHRTAAEWVKQPRVLERLRLASPKDFDPCMCLLRAEIIRMENSRDDFPGSDDFWKRITRSLLYASLVDGSITAEATLIDAMDQLQRVASYSLTSLQGISAPVSVLWPSHQPSLRHDEMLRRNSFNGLAVQFAVLPYIRCRYTEYPEGFHPVPSKKSKPLLEQAVFGFERYCAPRIRHGVDGSRIPPSQRCELVVFLLEQGVKQPGLLDLVEQIEPPADQYSVDQYGSSLDHRYWAEMRQLLESNKAAVGSRRSQFIRRLGWKVKKWTGD